MVKILNSRKIPEKAGAVIDSVNDSAKKVNQIVSEINSRISKD